MTCRPNLDPRPAALRIGQLASSGSPNVTRATWDNNTFFVSFDTLDPDDDHCQRGVTDEHHCPPSLRMYSSTSSLYWTQVGVHFCSTTPLNQFVESQPYLTIARNGP
jgi:hypothetical protein